MQVGVLLGLCSCPRRRWRTSWTGKGLPTIRRALSASLGLLRRRRCPKATSTATSARPKAISTSRRPRSSFAVRKIEENCGGLNVRAERILPRRDQLHPAIRLDLDHARARQDDHHHLDRHCHVEILTARPLGRLVVALKHASRPEPAEDERQEERVEHQPDEQVASPWPRAG
jgi:hypothetical protein